MVRKEMSNEEKLAIQSMKSNGVSVKELAKRFKRSSKLISRALKEMSAANGVVFAAAATTGGATETTAPLQQAHEPQLQVPQRAESSTQLLPVLPYEIHQQPLQMNAQLLPPPPKQQRTAKRKSSARPPPPLQPSYAPLPLYVPSGSLDVPRDFMTDTLPAASSATTALPLPMPTPAVELKATQTGRQTANPQPIKQSPLPLIPTPQLQETTSLSYAPRQMEKSSTRRVSTLSNKAQPKQSPSPEHHQVMPQREPAATSSDQSEPAFAAPPVQPTSVAPATTLTPVDTIPRDVGARNGGILAVRRPITRPPRVFPFTRPTSAVKASAGNTCKDKTSAGMVPGSSASEIEAAPVQRGGGRSEIMSSNPNLMPVVFDLTPDDGGTSPQTSQEDRLASSQFDNLSQASSTSTITCGASTFQFSQLKRQAASSEINQQEKISQIRAPTKAQLVVNSRKIGASLSQIPLHQQRECGKANRGLSEDCPNNKRDLQHSISSLEDQVVNMRQEHIGDERHRVVSAIRGDLGSMSADTAAECSERKRKREEDTDNMILGKLLHEKMAAEVALMNLQVQREKAQLARERMTTEVEIALSRKKLEDAMIPQSTIDSIFAQLMADLT